MSELAIKLNDKNPVSIMEKACDTDKHVQREKIQTAENIMMNYPQVEMLVNHLFHGDMYLREITIPKDTLLTGRIHKFDHFDIMLSGDVSVSSDDGTLKRLTGLNIMKGLAGKKRIGYAHEETHWITVHSAQEQNPEDMYEFLTCGSFEELEDFHIALENAMRNINESERFLTEHAQKFHTIKEKD